MLRLSAYQLHGIVEETDNRYFTPQLVVEGSAAWTAFTSRPKFGIYLCRADVWRSSRERTLREDEMVLFDLRLIQLPNHELNSQDTSRLLNLC